MRKYIPLPKLDLTKGLALVSTLGVAGLWIRSMPSGTVRWVMLGCLGVLVLAAVGIPLAFRAVRQRRARSLFRTLDNENERAVATSAAAEQGALRIIRDRFDKAVETLKKSKKSVYDIPWIMLIGEPKSGKTTVLKGSSLHFPIGLEDVSGLGGTRNCDWFFSNEAVILDTAGRYSFHSEAAPDRAEWEAFLRLLAKGRRDCPINGVIVIVPVTSLLQDSFEQRKEKGRNIRAKLSELQRTLGVQFPVFLVLTKCDLVVGFSEFFREFGFVQAAQMVGWTNDAPFDKPYDHDRFENDFAAISRKIRAFGLGALRRPAAFEHRGLICTFSEAFRGLGAPLQQYLSEIFATDVYNEPLFFRGFYFTSGMQEGAPIAAILENVLRGGRSPAGANSEFDKLGELFPPRPFFCTDFFKSKALKETGMVCRSAKQIKNAVGRKRLVYYGGGALAIVLGTLGGIGGWKVRSSVAEPTALAGAACLNDPDCQKDFRPSAPAPSADKLMLARALHEKARTLTGNPWIKASLLRPDLNFAAQRDQLYEIHDQLVLEQLIRPRVTQLEFHLGEPENWTSENGAANWASLEEYLRWYIGAPGLESSASGSFDRLVRPIDVVPHANGMNVDGTGGHFGSTMVVPRSAQVPATPTSPATTLTEYAVRAPGRLRWALSPSAADESPNAEIHKMFIAATQWLSASLGGKDSELQQWVSLYGGGLAAQDKYCEIVRLTDTLANVKTKKDFEDAVEKWSNVYGADPGGFRLAAESFRNAYDQLSSRASSPSHGLPPRPTADELIKKLKEGYLDKLRGIVNSAPATLDGPTRNRLIEWLGMREKTLNDEVNRLVKNQLDEKKEKLKLIDSNGKIAGSLASIQTALADLDATLKEAAKAAQCDGNVDHWYSFLWPARPDAAKSNAPGPGSPANPAIKPSINASVSAAEQPAVDCSESSPTLDQLKSAVERAADLRRTYGKLAAAEEVLKKSQEFEFGRDADAGKKDPASTGYDELQKRYTGGFLRDTIASVSTLQKALGACAAGCTLTDGVAGNANPAVRLDKLLKEKADDYISRYFSAWSKVAEERLYPADVLNTSSWDQFVGLMAVENPSKLTRFQELQQKAERQLKSFVSSVLAVDVHAAPKSLGEYLEPIRTNRDAAEICDKLSFSTLVGEYSEWTSQCADKSATPSDRCVIPSLARNLGDLRISLNSIGKSAVWVEGAKLPDLSFNGIEELSGALLKNPIIAQAYDLAQHAKWLLNRAVDQELVDLVQSVAGDQQDAFPFTSCNGRPVCKEVDPTKFGEFITKLNMFEKQYKGILDSRIGPSSPLGFIEKCRQFEQLRSTPVNYNLKYYEAKDSKNRVTGAFDSAEIRIGSNTPIVFGYLQDQESKKNLSWSSASSKHLSFEWSKPGKESSKEPDLNTAWALPRFVLDNRWQIAAGGAPGEVVYLVEIGVGNRFASFRVEIPGGMEIPDTIGNFTIGQGEAAKPPPRYRCP